MVDIDAAELAQAASAHSNAGLRRCRRVHARDAGARISESNPRIAPRGTTAAPIGRRAIQWSRRSTATPRPGQHLSSGRSDRAARPNADDLMISGSSGSGIEIFLARLPHSNRPADLSHGGTWAPWALAIPGSIGVCLAGGRRRTICVDGDGGFQFNIQELETVARLNLPIKFFVLNNDGYASIRASQSELFRHAQHRLRFAHRADGSRYFQSRGRVWAADRDHRGSVESCARRSATC